jgi:hypothetical protein
VNLYIPGVRGEQKGPCKRDPRATFPSVQGSQHGCPSALPGRAVAGATTSDSTRTARARLYRSGLRFGIVGLYPQSNFPALTRYDALDRRGRPVYAQGRSVSRNTVDLASSPVKGGGAGLLSGRESR